MSEGGIYLCKWRQVEGEYFLELQANPSLVANGGDLEECKEEICMQIISWNGDGEAILELFPPEKGKKYVGGIRLFSTAGYNDSVRAVGYSKLGLGGRTKANEVKPLILHKTCDKGRIVLSLAAPFCL